MSSDHAKAADHRGKYSRGYIPHNDLAGRPVGITFRLVDSVPTRLLRAYAHFLDCGESSDLLTKLQARVRTHVEDYLAKAKGICVLRDERAAAIVEEVLREGHPAKYELIAWVVMPNHVHVLIRQTPGSSLPSTVRTWKGRSARRINDLLGRTGPLWFREYFNRDIREGEDELDHAIRYIEMNPVKAGLCGSPTEWRFSSARERLGMRPAEAGGPCGPTSDAAG